MKFLYRVGLSLVSFLLPLLGLFNPKLRKFSAGRKDLISKLRDYKSKNPARPVWFHVASLGEYEQAKPVINELRRRSPEQQIVLSFFSPSGYEPASKKKQPNVDFVTYLPLDLKEEARVFVHLLNPSQVFFVKYDLWYEHISAIKERGVPIFLISALFRPTQNYFKSDGFFRSIIFQLNHIFTQNKESVDLLTSIAYSSASLVGDTRFDRVYAQALAPQKFPQLQTWVGSRKAVVLGSVWEEDMDLLIPLINRQPDYRWIIAPHDLNQEKMRDWAQRITLRTAFFTKAGWNDSPQVLFLDTIGMLSSVYQFARVAYVGGAFGSGLHNILEPIGFRVPVLFGKVRLAAKFPEAKVSQEKGCGFQVQSLEELAATFDELEDKATYQKASDAAERWLLENLGAAEKICNQVEIIMKNHER